MTKQRYVIEENVCNCHPETCGCTSYSIVNTETNVKVMSAMQYGDLKILVEKLNTSSLSGIFTKKE